MRQARSHAGVTNRGATHSADTYLSWRHCRHQCQGIGLPSSLPPQDQEVAVPATHPPQCPHWLCCTLDNPQAAHDLGDPSLLLRQPWKQRGT